MFSCKSCKIFKNTSRRLLLETATAKLISEEGVFLPGMFLLGLPTFYEILLFSQHLNCLAILKDFWKFAVNQPQWIINSPYILRRLSEIIILPGSIIISENRVEIVGVGHSSCFWKCLSSIIFNYYKKMTPLPSNLPPHFIKFE